MSGIEIAGLAIGILPLLVELVKSYSAILRRAHTFRHYGKAVKSLSTQLDTQNGLFMNEIRLLFLCVEDEAVVESMLADASDQHWTRHDLGKRLHLALGDNFIICRNIIEEISEMVVNLRKDLEQFDVFWDRKSKGESIKSVIRRWKGVVVITLDEAQHAKCLASLRDRNGDLSTLRLQINALQEHPSNRKRIVVPKHYNTIQIAARKLHEALCEAWCCDDAAHRSHYAKLCLDAKVQSEVQLDLAISCHEPDMNSLGSPVQLSPIWLHVQSTSTSGTGTNVHIHHKAISDLSSTISVGTTAPRSIKILKKKPSSELEQSSGSRKRLKWAKVIDVSSNDECFPVNIAVEAQETIIEINLCQTKNMCHYIRSHHEAMREAANSGRCIGYLETPQMYRHRFYVRERDVGIERHVSKLHSIFDAMRCGVEDVLDITDQVRLAHRTSRAILQYNNTPWLNSRWRLRDMKFFGLEDDLNEDALKTLHVSSQLSPPKNASTTRCSMEDIQGTQNTVSDEIRYGINNMTLFFLGVALLEIAHWKPIEDQMTTRDLNDEVFAARRIASQPTQLGPVYQKIARKCLQGNFGTEPDLGHKNLQTAVYNDVICELESMLQKLEV